MSGPGTSAYSAQSISGYNSSPPADDGSEVEANRVTWAKIKTKLADPIKTLAEAIDTELQGAFGKVPNMDDTVTNLWAGQLAFESDELTISSGNITPDRVHHTVDTESAAASDDLANILTTNTDDEAILIIRAANTARTVVVKDAATGAGQIHLNDSKDYDLDDDQKSLILQRRGTDWYELTRSETTSGWVLIGTEEAPGGAGTATLDVTGLDSTYDTYAIGLSDLVPITDAVKPYLRVGDSGGVDSGATDYAWGSSAITMGSETGAEVYDEDDADAQILLNDNNSTVGNAAGEGFGAMIFLHRPGDGTVYPNITGNYVLMTGGTQPVTGLFGGARLSVITLDRVQFLFSSGNVETGRLTVWGINHG